MEMEQTSNLTYMNEKISLLIKKLKIHEEIVQKKKEIVQKKW